MLCDKLRPRSSENLGQNLEVLQIPTSIKQFSKKINKFLDKLSSFSYYIILCVVCRNMVFEN